MAKMENRKERMVRGFCLKTGDYEVLPESKCLKCRKLEECQGR